MVYWAEGTKNRNSCQLSNSDPQMMRNFKMFLTDSMGISPEKMTIALNVHLGNGLSIEEIEEHWLDALDLPRSVLRKHTINNLPTSSSGKKTNKLPFGVCSLRVYSTELVQHIFGAIQQYGGFDEPRWLDCDRVKPADDANEE